jgi:D-xylose transport system substrate-binding protein|uniref:sugar ABC transporter substrate-binding protein n=1 Tax=Candidatus Planktophila sp. TaxID=2175601 RepID=UPI0040496454
MANRRNTVAAIMTSAALVLTGFVSASTATAASVQVGVILPDAASSARWETADRKFLKAAFKKAKVTVDIQNANGDKAKFATIADQMLAKGVKVLIMAGLDSPSTAAIQAKAKKAGVKTIDYDRLTLQGSASYYVSFDNEAVGKLQGEGIQDCLDAAGKKKASIVYLNGSPTDNNATLFKKGYDSVLRPLINSGAYTLVDDQAVPDWDNAKGGVIFEQQLTKAGGKIDAVVSANEGLGLAAVAVLKKNGLNGKVCVSGQDATADGLAAILTGDLSNTVYKAIKQEANGAAKLAIALIKGKKVKNAKAKTDNGKRKVPSVLLVPVGITKANVKVVIADGFQTREDVCKIATEAVCKANGI